MINFWLGSIRNIQLCPFLNFDIFPTLDPLLIFIFILKSANFQDGLVKNNMDKLTFYALSSPEKLDRIGEYLAARLSRDVDKRRTMYVCWLCQFL